MWESNVAKLIEREKLNSKLISLLNTKKTISHCFKVNNFTKKWGNKSNNTRKGRAKSSRRTIILSNYFNLFSRINFDQQLSPVEILAKSNSYMNKKFKLFTI
jgi:hypothetical protein